MGSEQRLLQATHFKTRLLLALWDLGGLENPVPKGKLNDRMGRKKENAGEYDKAYQHLRQNEAIAIVVGKRKIEQISLTDQGFDLLGQSLRSGEFRFDKNVGAWLPNTLVRWICQVPVVIAKPITSGDAVKLEVISSYDEFKSVALEIYDSLNQNYNLSDLVPIYRIRREIGDRVSRKNFNSWLLKMQADDILQLQGGSLPDNDPAKLEDSITTEVSGLRCYAKRLIS